MDFEVEQTAIGDGNTVLVSVYGELDLATCAELASVADELASTHRPVILDLSACPFIDSTGLRQVLELSDDDADAAAAPVAIVSPRGSATSDLFALTRLDERLKLFGTVEDALVWLETKPGPG